MKNSLLLLLLGLLSTLGAQATPAFKTGEKYRLVCKYYGTGATMLGSAHGSKAYIYYNTTSDEDDDAWWYVEAEGNGYTLRNATNNYYITYSSERIENVAKGLVLSTASQGTTSQWTFNDAGDGYYTIANVDDNTQWFNVRTDGTYLVGTYTGNTGSKNELFAIYDSNGNQLTEDGDDSTDGDVRSDFNAKKGITLEGEYWELQGLSQPVVYTTDTTNPVLYSIANLRSSQYVYTDGSSLLQTADPDSRTHFYFVEQSDGSAQIFTEGGLYVSTVYDHSTNQYVSVESGTPSGNLWKAAWTSSYSPNGYGITKTDNKTSTGGNQGGWGGPGGGGPGGWGNIDYAYWNDYSNTFIGLYSLDDGGTFVFTSSDKRHVSMLNAAGITFKTGSQTNTTNLHAAVDSIRIGGKDLIYDTSSKLYYAPLPSRLLDGGDYTAAVEYLPKAGYDTLSLRIDSLALSADSTITLKDVTCSRTYPVCLVDAAGEVKASAQLQFTFMPIIEARVASCNKTSYTTGTFRLTDADEEGYDTTMIAAFRYRGATASGFEKKAYNVKFYDAEGNSEDHQFFGLREDNNWILDAMAVDPACMRNRVATDIWNDYATKPYYADREKKALTGTRGHFVEMFLNGRYNGIYCMTEKMDRKQLKLKKFKSAADSKSGEAEVHGLLYKADQWCYEVFFGHESGSSYYPGTAPRSYSNTLGQETWASFEFKYPDYEEEAVDWEPLWKGINFVTTSSQTTFENGVASYFDLPVVNDYYLFLDLLLATDNHGKNMLYYVYDRQGTEGDRLSLAPWDLDGTLGARWDGSTSYTKDYTQDFENFLNSYEHGEYGLFYKLRKSTTLNWKEQLAKRYAELRRGNWQPETLAERFTAYGNLFSKSNADKRETNRWGTKTKHTNIPSAVTYCENWIKGRLEALDSKYGYDPTIDAVNDAVADEYLAIDGGYRQLVIHSGKAQRLNVYSLSGTLVRTVDAAAGETTVDALTPGVYVVGGKKVVVQ